MNSYAVGNSIVIEIPTGLKCWNESIRQLIIENNFPASFSLSWFCILNIKREPHSAPAGDWEMLSSIFGHRCRHCSNWHFSTRVINSNPDQGLSIFSLFFFYVCLFLAFHWSNRPTRPPGRPTRPPGRPTRPPGPSARATGYRTGRRSTVGGRRSAVGGPEARRPGGRVNRPVYRWSGRRVAGRWPVWRRRQRGSGPAAAATATGRVMALMNILNPIRWYLFITIFFLTSGIYNWITERRWAMNNLNFRPVSIC